MNATMAQRPTYDLNALRQALESLAQLDGETPRSKVAELDSAFRDCRLELFRLMPDEFSESQKLGLHNMEGRLHQVARYSGSPDSIASAAQRTLELFGWSPHT
jgi:hypothetical protein